MVVGRRERRTEERSAWKCLMGSMGDKSSARQNRVFQKNKNKNPSATSAANDRGVLIQWRTDPLCRRAPVFDATTRQRLPNLSIASIPIDAWLLSLADVRSLICPFSSPSPALHRPPQQAARSSSLLIHMERKASLTTPAQKVSTWLQRSTAAYHKNPAEFNFRIYQPDVSGFYLRPPLRCNS